MTFGFTDTVKPGHEKNARNIFPRYQGNQTMFCVLDTLFLA